MKDGGRAFPSEGAGEFVEREGRSGEIVMMSRIGQRGMSLRDWFAGQALAGQLAAEIDGMAWEEDKLAARCYRFADAMIAEGGEARDG